MFKNNKINTARRARWRGFTLVELLVVIAIIGVLVALLLPAVQAAREAARRSSCQNNFKQVGVAFHNYLAARKVFPSGTEYRQPGATEAICPGTPTPDVSIYDSSFSGFGWGAFILPYMEQSALHDQLQLEDLPKPQKDGVFVDEPPSKNWSATANIVEAFICPSELNFEKWVDSATGIGHFGNEAWDWPMSNMAGVADTRRSHCYLFQARADANGMLFNYSGVKPAQVNDGFSQTYIVGEMTCVRGIDQANLSVWIGPTWVTRSVADVSDGINGPGTLPGGRDDATNPYDGDGGNRHAEYYLDHGFASWHPGGAHFLFADGSVQFVAEDTDDLVTCASASRAGSEVISGGTASVGSECTNAGPPQRED
jgi:prepilin-type N-terminal cleavage/methylation domain-containing protein/prepilin-type processing-associated H-X9-DG protein